MDRYELVATGVIVAIPLLLAVLLVGGVVWAQDAAERHPRFGPIGILVTAAAIGNLFVRQELGAATTRPVVALFVERGDAFRGALGSVAVVLLLVVATSVAVRLAAPTTATR